MPPIVFIAGWFIVLAIALTVLLKSADYFVKIAELIGKKLNVPSFIVGATVVAFGTSLPELAVGIISVLNDQADIVTGTIIGSNIGNIFFITGIAIVISSGFYIRFVEHRVEFLLLIMATALSSYFLWYKHLNFIEALLCIILLVIYLVYVIRYSGKHEPKEDAIVVNISPKQYILFTLSFVGVWLGANYTTEAITNVSSIWGLSNDVIAQTVVALGTSLPELAVTVAAARNKQFGIILGNVLGSNIFNLLAVLGIPAMVGYIAHKPYIVVDPGFNKFGIPLMIGATILLIIASLFKQTPKAFGILFILLYIFFMIGSFLKIDLSSLL